MRYSSSLRLSLPDFISPLGKQWSTVLALSLPLLLLLRLGLNGFSRGPRHPPGPKGHPFVGNTFQVPATQIWRYFADLGKKYGPIIRLSLAGDEVLVLNDVRDAEELLNRRSQNYSSRKQLIYAGKYQSGDKRLLLLPYGEEMKIQRTAFHQMLQARVVGSYDHMQEVESLKYLRDMLDKPLEAGLNAKRYAASLIFSLTYGRRLEDDDKDLKEVLEAVESFIRDCEPGAHLVDTFTMLDRLPNFLAPWRAEAIRKRQRETDLFSRLAMDAKARMAKMPYDCFASRLWEEEKKLKLDPITIAYICGASFEAGTDTTASTIMWFILAMVLHPRVLEEAQKEIDSVLGSDGSIMPTFSHLQDLPYCAAMCSEAFRWMPVGPTGFPHLSDREDEYKGFKIEGNTMVITNIWAYHQNETEFPDPQAFKPERFLKKDVQITSAFFSEGHYGFGFGRRLCPGKHLAGKTIWIGIVRLIWAFDILPGLDASGNAIPVDQNACSPGITTSPAPFPVRILPRSPHHAASVRAAWEKTLSEL